MATEETNKDVLGLIKNIALLILIVLLSLLGAWFTTTRYSRSESVVRSSCHVKRLDSRMLRGGSLPEPSDAAALFGSLSSDLVCLGQNSRPDSEKHAYVVTLGQKSFLLEPGEKGYLYASSAGWEYTNEPTPLSFTVDSRCTIKVTLSLGELYESMIIPFTGRVRTAALAGYSELICGKVVGEDRLLSFIGRAQSSARLKLSGQKPFHLKKGSLLFFDGAKWSESPDSTAPVAQLTSLTRSGGEFTLWSVDGLLSQTVRVASSKQTSQKPPQVRSGAFRSSSRCSCTVDGATHLLSVGDWLLKEEGKWRLLSYEEQAGVIDLQRSGELLLFDEIVCQGDEWRMSLVHFNEERSHMQTIVLPLGGARLSEKQPIKQKVDTIQ